MVELIEKWAPIDRSPHRLAHRGSYIGSVFVSPSTVRRVAVRHRLSVPSDPPPPTRHRLVAPDVPWGPNRLWAWEASEFATAGLVAYTIADVVTRYWLGFLLSPEESPEAVQRLYKSALAEEFRAGGLSVISDDDPVLVAWSGTGTDVDPPGGPVVHVQVESLFDCLRMEWPMLNLPSDPDGLAEALARVREDYNTLRLHPALGYVTPADEHHGRGPRIRDARTRGLAQARAERLRYNSRP